MGPIKRKCVLRGSEDSEGPYQHAHLHCLIRAVSVHLPNPGIMADIAGGKTCYDCGDVLNCNLCISCTFKDTFMYNVTGQEKTYTIPYGIGKDPVFYLQPGCTPLQIGLFFQRKNTDILLIALLKYML